MLSSRHPSFHPSKVRLEISGNHNQQPNERAFPRTVRPTVIATGLRKREHFQLARWLQSTFNCSSLSLDAVMGEILITALTALPVEPEN